MNSTESKTLCIELMKADSEEDVISLLREAGYWDAADSWRFYGGYENNYNTIGNQQSRPDATLVEKIVNSVDARLMNEALLSGIDIESEKEPTPQSIREAVARFFDGEQSNPELAGKIREWTTKKRTEVARGITLACTGRKPPGSPCFIIADSGEGQTPASMHETLLSLNRSNKLRIPFVQGKFNMGGSGVLQFCGKNNLELILTRRNPSLLDDSSNPDDQLWGFTVVRRVPPVGNRRSSEFTYLAPGQCDSRPRQGDVLRFPADSMLLFPVGREPFARDASWGTLIKLYEYSIPNRSDILRKDGMLSRIDLLLPHIALPIRVHECRDYGGHEGSAETTMTGIGVRLDEGKGDNMEDDFPCSCQFRAAGNMMTATIYAFKKGKADIYRKDEGIIFTMNGQTHGRLTKDFFTRKRAGRLSYLKESLLVVVNCSEFTPEAHEELFMNSRDRLRDGELKTAIERGLESLLKKHEGIRALRERRRREEIQEKLDDSKPLENILKDILKNSPALSALFLPGKRISNPFKTKRAGEKDVPFRGERYPTYFKFRNKKYGYRLERKCQFGKRVRVAFETDACNEYFSRDVEAGQFGLKVRGASAERDIPDYSVNLQNGVATLNLELPQSFEVGQRVSIETTVLDPYRSEPFTNELELRVCLPTKAGGDNGTRRKPPGNSNGPDHEIPNAIDLPEVILVTEEGWMDHEPPFEKYTALRVKATGASDEDGADSESYDFYINMDNVYLNTELKSGSNDSEVIRAQFKYGLVLLGLGLLQEDLRVRRIKKPSSEGSIDEAEDSVNVEDDVDKVTKAVAPIIVPMIESLGSLDLGAVEAMSDSAGEPS